MQEAFYDAQWNMGFLCLLNQKSCRIEAHHIINATLMIGQALVVVHCPREGAFTWFLPLQVEQDFSLLLPDNDAKFLEQWPSMVEDIVTLARVENNLQKLQPHC